MTLPDIGSLWIGRHLSFLERLCMKSFVDAGHRFTLYTFEQIEDPPDWVEIADARAIYPEDTILVHTQRNSPAIHSDVFRVKMIARTGKIWADLDAYCLRPFRTYDGYLMAWQDRRLVNNGVLALPPGSRALAELEVFLSTRGAVPPWWSDADKAQFAQQGAPADFATLPWATTGPYALTHFLRATGEISHALPANALYPVPSTAKRMFFRHPGRVKPFLTDQTLSIHFYATGLRARLSSTPPRPGSYLHTLAQKHEISISDHPVKVWNA